ncbi:ABC transporter substrate-binding protein, partial [Nonomuraea sp. RK-328]|nr:ABC transporter substrate-binding protein [Nonomuraea sp. RK-328]
MVSRRAACSAAIYLGLLTTAACGGGAQGGGAQGGGALATAPSDVTLPTDIPDSLAIGVPSGLTSLDPNLVVQEVDVMTMTLISGTLLVADSSTAGYRPALADRCEWTADTTYGCTLKVDAKFSDGTPLTSEDVVASFRRAIDDKGNANAGLVANIRNVVAQGPARVSFDLKGPQASFPLVLTESPLGVFPKERGADKDFYTKPLSAGPYLLQSRSSSRVEFVRNPHYPKDLRPVVNRLAFVKVVDAGSRVLQLKTGSLDAIYQIPANLAADIKSPAKSYLTSQYGSLFIYMNHKVKPLDNRDVRKAISYAIDRELINKVAFNGKNRVIGGFFPTTMEGHDPRADTRRDLAKAKQLLSGTPCAAGCTIEMMTRAGYSPYDTISTVVAANLKEVGIDVKIKTVDQATANANEGNGNFAMEVGGLYDVVNSPELIMLTYGLTPEGGINALFSSYYSPRINALYKKLVATQGDARRPILDEINAIFAEDIPYVPLCDFVSTWASRVSPRILSLTAQGAFRVGTTTAGPGQ